MFDFKEELKYYEPGLETVEASMSGDEDKDMVELMQILLQARPDPLAAAVEETAESEPVEAEAAVESEADAEQKEPTEA